MARVLVTGASGFVGRAAVDALRERGHEIHAVARRAAPEVDADAWHEADVLSPTAVDGVVRAARASHLLHLAWATEHGAFWDDPTNSDWSSASLRLVQAFAEVGGVRAVVAGSCAQYDWSQQALGPSGRADEATSPRRPATVYGSAKQAAAEKIAAWSAANGFSSATGLLFFPYGPFDKAERLVPSVTLTLEAGHVATVKTGSEVRDFVHVSDCAEALAALLDSDVAGDVNIGTSRGSSVADVASSVARLLGREDLLEIEPRGEPQPGSRVIATNERLRGEVGFTPRVDLEAGLESTVAWWRDAALQRTRRR
jgi:nucleoside-diphosphate-sugar epimerase